MWTYSQADGRLYAPDGSLAGQGYSGFAQGKNNPLLQSVRDMGPIPQGIYAIGSAYDSVQHGPFAMALAPDAANEMFGRAGFLMHGDSLEAPGCASRGCIIMPRAVREAVNASADRGMQVVARYPLLVTDPELGL